MNQDVALKLVEEFFRASGLDGPEDEDEAERASDEGINEDLFAGGDPNLAFRFFSETGTLKCFALIYEFTNDPKKGVLKACHDEAARPTTDMGGGKLEYDPKDKGLYLVKKYEHPVPGSVLKEDLLRLYDASIIWGEHVLDRVAMRVHPI